LIQIVLMCVGIAYVFRLMKLGAKVRANSFGMDPDTLSRWRDLRQKQYLWMIAAGWGVAAGNILVGAMITGAGIRLTSDSALIVQIAALVVSLVAMFMCWNVSSKARALADGLESQKSPATAVEASPGGGSQASVVH
jgi:hypothetical protein